MLPRPAWLAVGVVMAAGLAAWSGGVAGAVVVAAGAVAAACVSEACGRRRLCAALAVAALGAALVVARLALGVAVGGPGADAPPALPAGSGPWQATVESSRAGGGRQIATLGLTGGPLRCSALLPAYPRLIAGDIVSWSGRVEPLADSDYDRYLAAQGIAATCEATDVVLVRHDDSPAGRLEGFRQASGDALQRVLPEPEGGLAAAILIGLRDRVDRDVAAAFTTAGVSHIVAISGWNIAVVAATIAALLRGFVSRRRRAIVTVGAIVAYTLFAGASASVIRAALMAGIAFLAVESGRGSRAMVGLAWAVALMLIVEPATIGDVGFQLSAAATAGLIAWGTPLARWLEARAPRLPAPVRESLAISLAAQAATLPIVLLVFGRLALIAPAANLVAVPLVPPAMAAGALAFGAGWLATAGAPVWLAGLLAMPAWLLLLALVAVVQVAASIPGANQTLPFPANAIAAALAGLALWRLHVVLGRPRKPAPARAQVRPPPRRQARPKSRWAMAGAALLIVLAGSVVAGRPDGSVHVLVLDVGQGDAILLEGDRGSRILVDGGPDATALLAALDRYVPAWDRRLDAIVLTHPHDDHVAGLVAVVQRYRVGRAFESGWPSSTPAYRAWKDALASRGLVAERLSTGEALRLDDATLRVLWPDDGCTWPSSLDADATENRMTNDASIVLLGEYEGRRFLLTGDAEEDVDPVLVERGLPAVDLLKVAHHGSATASSDALLAAVRPAVAAISVGADNSYGHPAPGTLARLRAHARTILRTDDVGTIDIKLDRSAVTVTSSRAEQGRGPSPAVGLAVLPAFGPAIPLAARPALGFGIPPAVARSGLMYDSIDVRPQPSTEHGLAPFTRSTGLAPPPRADRRRDGGLAGAAGAAGWAVARSPPRGSGRSPPRRRQAPRSQGRCS